MKYYQDKQWLFDRYITENKTIEAISEIAGVSRMTIRRYLKKFNIVKDKQAVYESRRSLKHPVRRVVVKCNKCGENTEKPVDYYKRRTKEGINEFYCDKTCADIAHSERMAGEGNPNYGGSWNGPNHDDIPREIFIKNGQRAIERMKRDGTYDERMRKLHEGHNKFFATPEGKRIRISNGVRAVTMLGKGARTSIEIKMADELSARGIDYIEQYNVGDRYVVDFYIPKYNIIIECDGDYWHNLPEVVAKDKRKNVYIKACGYSLYRFWEHEINTDVSACVDIVLAEINENEAIT